MKTLPITNLSYLNIQKNDKSKFIKDHNNL